MIGEVVWISLRLERSATVKVAGSRGNQINDVNALKELNQLTYFGLQNSRNLTKSQIAELQKALPKYDINHHAKK